MRVALDEGTEGFRQSVTQTQQAFASMAHDVSNSSETLTSTLGETITEMKQSGAEFLKSLESHSKELHRNMEQNTTNVIDMFRRLVKRLTINYPVMPIICLIQSRHHLIRQVQG